MVCPIFQLLFVAFLLRDVVDDPDEMGHLAAVVAHRRNGQRVPEESAVFAVVAQDRVSIPQLVQGRAHILQPHLLPVVPQQKPRVSPRRFPGGVTGDLFEGGVGVDDRVVGAGGVDDHDAVAARIDGAQTQTQRLLRPLFLQRPLQVEQEQVHVVRLEHVRVRPPVCRFDGRIDGGVSGEDDGLGGGARPLHPFQHV